jgi:hypothetical protein
MNYRGRREATFLWGSEHLEDAGSAATWWRQKHACVETAGRFSDRDEKELDDIRSLRTPPGRTILCYCKQSGFRWAGFGSTISPERSGKKQIPEVPTLTAPPPLVGGILGILGYYP